MNQDKMEICRESVMGESGDTQDSRGHTVENKKEKRRPGIALVGFGVL
jgi:hypothetical protein